MLSAPAHPVPLISEEAHDDVARARRLAATLLLRGVVHAGFAIWLLAGRPEWTRIFQVGAYCGLADGTLGVLTVSLLLPVAPAGSPRFLAAMTFVDAMGRLGSSVALLALPGIPFFFITLGPFFGLVGACAAGVGLVAMTAWVVRRIQAGRSWSSADDELFDPLAVAAIASLIVGFVLLVNPPATAAALRVLGASVCVTLTAVFTVAAIGAARHRRGL